MKAEGAGTDSVELKFENGKIMAKYPEITDTKERSITFKVKVKDEVKIGGKIVNKAIIDDTKRARNTDGRNYPQHKDGKVEAEKTVNNPSPKLGEEIEYRISFKNTVENGKLAEVKIEDTLPNGLEYVKDSLQAEGSKPNR